jgi:hypothetical protein
MGGQYPNPRPALYRSRVQPPTPALVNAPNPLTGALSLGPPFPSLAPVPDHIGPDGGVVSAFGEGWLGSGERSGQTDQWLTIMGVTNPSPLSSPLGTTHKQTSSFPGPWWTTCPWCHAITPALGPPVPAPAPSLLSPRRGEPPPFCAHAHAHNRNTGPGTGPGAGPGEWSRVNVAEVGPEHGARHSFLWPPPSNLGGQSHPHRPPVKTGRRHHPAVITTWPAPW